MIPPSRSLKPVVLANELFEYLLYYDIRHKLISAHNFLKKFYLLFLILVLATGAYLLSFENLFFINLSQELNKEIRSFLALKFIFTPAITENGVMCKLKPRK